ncbi:hypothetical protein, partial [Breoghania sp.]|uniref:hypothetical protein n=1 Tax=Breoghania sp. TaxID=2065378 RepID=UPI002608A750
KRVTSGATSGIAFTDEGRFSALTMMWGMIVDHTPDVRCVSITMIEFDSSFGWISIPASANT